MPIYEYQCNACGHHAEVLQSINEPALRDCPACGRPALRKLVSAAGFRLSGTGWYETDFKSADKRNLSGDAAAPDKKEPQKAGEAGAKDAKKEKPATKKPAASPQPAQKNTD